MPLYLVLLLAGTLTPLRIHCVPGLLQFGLSPPDVALNLLLFLPFGAALAPHGPVRLAVLAAVLSGAIEVLQLWLPRHPSPADLLLNVTGALLGAAAHRPLRGAVEAALRPRVLLLAAAAGLAALAVAPGTRPALDFRDWEPDFAFLFGNEATGDRPWGGRIFELAVYDRALDAAPAGPLGPLPPTWDRGGPVLWLDFAQTGRGRFQGPGRNEAFDLREAIDPPPEPGRPLLLRGRAARLAPRIARALGHHFVSRHELSVVARVAFDDPQADGPARIVTFSRDPSHRNFTLGQREGDLEFRVRTPATGPNGHRPAARTPRGPLRGGMGTGRVWTVAGVFDGRRSWIGVEGACAGDAFVELAALPEWAGDLIHLSVALGVSLPALAAGGLARRRRRRLLLGGTAALLSVAAMRFGGLWSGLAGYDPIAAGVAAAALLACVPLLLRAGTAQGARGTPGPPPSIP